MQSIRVYEMPDCKMVSSGIGMFGEEKFESADNLLHISNTGKVFSIILRGDAEETEKQIMALSPVLCERTGLTLEEVFIYELGGLGYDFKNIIV